MGISKAAALRWLGRSKASSKDAVKQASVKLLQRCVSLRPRALCAQQQHPASKASSKDAVTQVVVKLQRCVSLAFARATMRAAAPR